MPAPFRSAAPELRDLRAKITVSTHVALTAIADSEGIEVSELVRNILDSWAIKRLQAAKRMLQQLEQEGEGTSGNVVEIPRSGER